MSKYTKHAVLGLSIAAASIAMATPASATLYKNFSNNEVQNTCLGVKGGSYWYHNTSIVTWGCDSTHPDQNWGEQPYPGTDDVQLWSGKVLAHQFNRDTSMCIALANDGSVKPNDFIPGWAIIWECRNQTTDQVWHRVYVGNDFNGHQCFYLRNKKAFDAGYNMVLTVDPNQPPNVAAPVYLYWWNGWAQQIWCAY